MKNLFRLLNSVSLLTCLILLLIVGTAVVTDPCRVAGALRRIDPDSRPVVAKLPIFFDSPGSPDILLMGSSLWLTPARLCDEYYCGTTPPADHHQGFRYRTGYLQAKHFQQMLSRHFGQQRNVVNLSIAGAAMSDQLLLLEKMVETGKHPKLILLAVAPRDFQDNTNPRSDNTLPYKLLSDTSWNSALAKYNGNPLLSPLITCCEMLEHLPILVRQSRSDIYNCVSRFTGHPATLALAALSCPSTPSFPGDTVITPGVPRFDGVGNGFANEEEHQQLLAADLAQYRKRYIPLNQSQIDFQMSCLTNFLQRAKQAKLKTIVINMPLTDINKQLLPSGFYQTFVSSVKDIAEIQHTQLVDINSNGFTDRDFMDSCHLNAFGGHKLFTQLCDASFGALVPYETATSTGSDDKLRNPPISPVNISLLSGKRHTHPR